MQTSEVLSPVAARWVAFCNADGAPLATPEAAAPTALFAAGAHAAHARVRPVPEWQRAWDFFTNFGTYIPRSHCMVSEAGGPDWPWVAALITLMALVVGLYLRVWWFWRRAYLAEAPRDRNHALMDLAWVFLLCAVCGYAMSIVTFVWPAYRLLAVFLAALVFFTARFCRRLDAFGMSFSALRFQREAREALEARAAELQGMVDERTRELELERARLAEMVGLAHELQARAQDADRAKSEFLANMSHEIRTPMTAILGFADILAEEEQPQRRREAARTIRRNGDHLLRLINDVLDLSKIEAGRVLIEPAPTSPREVVAGAVELLRPRAAEKGLRLEFAPALGAGAPLVTDATRLRQITLNLIANAVKFTDAGGVRVDLEVGEDPAPGGRALLTLRVTDTGPGIAPDRLARLFSPFEQGDGGISRRFGGTGLGLHISRRLARLLGGDIVAASTPGVGSTFTLRLRAARASRPEAEATPARPAPAPRPAPGRLDGRRVLLAEDGPDNQRLVRHHVTRAGAGLTIVGDGAAAVEAVLSAHASGLPFDLVLMDVQMPGVDGLEATRRLRAAGERLPVIALTANAFESDRAACLEAGCDEHVPKPVDFPALIELCARTLGPGDARAAA